MATKISKNFTLEEMTYSANASAKGIDNTPDATSLAHLQELVNNMLQPIRDAYGKGIKVTSGYRNKKTNELAGGASSSSHMYGFAADIKPVDVFNVPLGTTYEYILYSAETPDGLRNMLTVTDITVSGPENVCVVEEDGQLFLRVPAGFEGEFDLLYHFTDPLTGDSTSHAQHYSYVSEIWYLDIDTDNSVLLPGEERTVTAEVTCMVFDADSENGWAYGDTSDAAIVWEVETFPGVSSVPNGNAVTVKTTAETGVDSTIAVTGDMVAWDSAFDGTAPGVYTATVTYQGAQLGTIQVTVK